MIEGYGFCKVKNIGVMPVSQSWLFGDRWDDIPGFSKMGIADEAFP